MAHDLATPATVLESQLQAMIDGVVPADRDQLERARAAASAMSGVIVQLRELVDVEAAVGQRTPRRTALGALISDVAAALEPFCRERDVSLEAESADGLWVDVDPNQVSRALRNVVTNAAQHAPPGSAVLVTAEREGSEIVARVTDRGSGIAPQDVPHIFERFYRADRARGPTDREPRAGSGIGLTIARELLAANGGSIGVERTGSDGTTFAIRVPAAT
jgi:two-component system sensor histidine kinase BaeS